MRDLMRLIVAIAAILEEFAASGGVQILTQVWRSKIEQSQAQTRLANERRLASALARGDLDAVESHAAQLLTEASHANRDRTAARAVDRSGFWHGDDHDEFVGRNNVNVETLQKQVDRLI